MADKYWRLVSLVVNDCPKPLLELLIYHAKNDPNSPLPFTNIHDYMKARSSDVNALPTHKPKKHLSRSQRNQVLPSCVSTPETQWDVTLLVSLLLWLFTNVLQKFEIIHIRKIRDVRNALKHKGSTACITDDKFSHDWNDITNSMVFLTKASSGDLEAIQARISKTMIEPLPGLMNTIVGWSESTERECLSVCQVVDAAVVERANKHGHPIYRFKAEDSILERLRESFQREANAVSSIETNHPMHSQIDTVLDCLQNHGYAIITGSCPLQQHDAMQLAFLTAQKVGVDMDRCVMMTFSNDWRHVNPDEIDVVIYSLEGESRDVRVLNDMFSAARAGTLKIIVHASSGGALNNSYKSILAHVEHKKDAVVNIVTPKENESKKETYQTEVGGVLSNMMQLTKSYLEQQRNGDLFDPICIVDAVRFMKTHKTVLVTSADDVDHRNFLAPLAKRMNSKRTILLNHPEDFKYIQPGQVDFLIIEHFLGKYRYDAEIGTRWCSYFDMLEALLAEKNLSAVVITCHENKLKSFQNQMHDNLPLQRIGQLGIGKSRVLGYKPGIQVEEKATAVPVALPVAVITPTADTLSPPRPTIMGKSKAYLQSEVSSGRRRYQSTPIMLKRESDRPTLVCAVPRFEPSDDSAKHKAVPKVGRLRNAYLNIVDFCCMLYEYIEA